ncbi:MAG: NADPH-dependent FMN reductase [Bacteroidota bacterium]
MTYSKGSPLKIVAVQGSVRPDNNTRKAIEVLARTAERMPGLDFEILDPTGLDLPLPGAPATPDVEWMRAKLHKADGIILATPEYHGSYSSVIKLVIDNLGFPSPLKDKPVSLLGVAAGRIGAIKSLEHLRGVAAHLGAHVLPMSVSIPLVREAFDEGGNLMDPAQQEFVEGALHRLIQYLSQTKESAAQICELHTN